MDPTDFSPEFNAKMHELYVNGITPDQVRAHFADSKNPEHQKWVEQMDRASALQDQDVYVPPQDTVVPEIKRDTSTPLLDMYGKSVEQAKTAAEDMSLGTKIGLGAGAAVLAGGAGAIGNRLLSRILPTPTERATALQANTYAKKTDLEAQQLAKENGPSAIEQAKVSEIEAKIARENAAHQLELEQKKELHQAKLAKINEKLMKGETITPAEPTKGLAELENATGGPLNSATDVKLAQRFQAQNAPVTPPAATPASVPATPPAFNPPEPLEFDSNPQPNPVKVAEAATPPSTFQGGAPVQPGGDVTVDENALKEAASNPVEKALNPELATNVQAKTDLQNKQVQDAILKPAQPTPVEPAPKVVEVSPQEIIQKKAPKAPKVPPMESLSKAQNSMRNYFIGSQNFTPEQYDEFVTKVYGGVAPEMGAMGGGLSAEDQAKYKSYRKENIEGPKVNLTRDMKKVIKAGGVATLLSLPAFINAKTAEERNQIIRDFGEGMLPIGVTPTEAGAPGLTPAILESQRQATLLGSPYRKTEKKSKR
jgi:hypothetical protein